MDMYAGRPHDGVATMPGSNDPQDLSITPGCILAVMACDRAQQVVDDLEDQWVRCGFDLTLPVRDRIRVLDEAAATAENRLADVARSRTIIERELHQTFAAMESSRYDTIGAGMISSANENLAKITAALFTARDFIAAVRRQINVGEGSLLFSGALAETLAQYGISSRGPYEGRTGGRTTVPGIGSDVR